MKYRGGSPSMLLLRIASSPPRLRGGGEEVKKIFFSKGGFGLVFRAYFIPPPLLLCNATA